jgi:hypothetical protein
VAAQDSGQPIALPADLGHTVELVGYSLTPESVVVGGEAVLVSYWRILAAPDPDLDSVLFAHVLAPDGEPRVITQQDRLDAPAWNWHPGDSFAQAHRFRIGTEVPAGSYLIEIGAYSRRPPSPIEPDPPVERWPLYVDGRVVADHITLQPILVRGQADP